MENLIESESVLGCKVKDVTRFIKQHVQSIRNEVILKNKQLNKAEKENKLINIRHAIIPSIQVMDIETVNQKPNCPSLVSNLLPEVILCLYQRHHIFHLDRKDIINLRLVCKEWRLAVDKYFVGGGMKTSYGYFHSPPPKILLNDKNVYRFFHQFTSPVPAPMSYSVQSVIVDLRVSCPTKYSKPQFLKATKVLEIIGKSVLDFTWKTDVERNHDLPSAVTCHKMLRSWLNSMPNLTAIELSFKVDFWSEKEYKIFSTKLEIQLAINPFPRLQKLNILKVAYNVPNILVNSILKQNPTIQILRVSAEYPLENDKQILGCLWFGFLTDLQLNNLTELHIKEYDNHVETTRGKEFNVKLLKKVYWPLKILRLDFGGASRHDYANRNLQYLFSIANNFEQTLTKLEISNAGWTPTTDVKSLQLKLPHLEDFFLRVEFYPEVKSRPVHMDVDFDFLLELPLLKTLGLHLYEYLECTYNPEYLEEVVQLQGYFKCLYESQIWEVLPALQTVNLSTYCQYEKDNNHSYRYNRKGYISFLVSSMS